MQFRIRLLTSAALVVAGTAHAALTFDANLEHDVMFKAKQGSTKGETSNSGRVELNTKAELMKSGDNFVNAKASLIVPTGGGDSVGIDDGWVHFGNSSLDLKIGRQEAVDLFPLGKDVVLEAAIGDVGYRANTLRGRIKTGQVHAVAGLNASPALRFELGLVTGKTGYAYGVRPTVVLSAGALTLRAGIESIKQDAYNKNVDEFNSTGVMTRTTTPQAEASSQGIGLSAGYAMGSSASINANYAKNKDNKAQSTGLNAVFGDAGVGMVTDKTGSKKATTYYAAYSLPLMGVKGATITPAISTSKSAGVDDLNAFKVRFNYTF